MLKWFNSVILFCIIISSFAQAVKSDLEMIGQQDFEKHYFESRQVNFNQITGKSNFVKYNPVTIIANSFLFLYQQLFSVQISASCLYQPSCSEFSKNLIKEYGVVKGVPLSADRLTRCNRISATGIHPLKVDGKTKKVIETTKIYKNDK